MTVIRIEYQLLNSIVIWTHKPPQPWNECCSRRAQYVHSSSELHSLSLYSMFTPAVHSTACHCAVYSLQQCTSQPVTVQYVNSSSALHSLSLYSVFTPAVRTTACHSTLCSLQQCAPQRVTVQCVHSYSSLDFLSL